MQHIQVLVLEGLAAARVPRAICDICCSKIKVDETLSRCMLRPGWCNNACSAKGTAELAEHHVLSLRLVAHPNHERFRLLASSFHSQRQWSFGVHGSNALVCEEEVQPVCFELVALILLLLLGLHWPLSRRALCLHAPAVLELFLQSREDEHDLGAIGCICSTREGITNGVFSNLVQDCVQRELVGTDQFCDVLHDSHHLLCIGRQGMHPSSHIEANKAAAPGCKKRRSDLDRLCDTMAIYNQLSILVTCLQTMDELLC
mmetsp:Transcript_68706/g.121380  ORF Transcript_68706/g.121380 Transcript_68706/m.121380 type:complete len:259 (+) Transcript_68706:522-1298(+)